MNRSTLRLLGLWLTVITLLSAPLAAQVYEVEVKDRYSRSDLDEEQRVVEAYLRDASTDIDRAVARVGANLAQTARISLLRARNFLSLAEVILNGQQERIEQLARSIFYNEENVRQGFRDRYTELRSEFYHLEEQVLSLGREIDAKTGNSEVSRALQLISAVTKALPNIRNDATRAELEGILQRLSGALEANDEAAANRILGELEAFIEQKGDEVPIDLDSLPAKSGPAAPSRPTPGPAAPASPAGPAIETFTDPATGDQVSRQSSTRRLPNGAEVNTITETRQHGDGSTSETVTEETLHPDGSRTVVRTTTKTLPDGSKQVSRVVEEYDAAGNLLSTNGSRDAISATGQRSSQGSYTVSGDRITIQSPDGKAHSFIRDPNGQYKVVEVRYIGGEGFRLTGERELFYELQPMSEGDGSVQFRTRVGSIREWNFEIAEIPANREFSIDSMKATFVFRDALQKGDFTISGWQVMGPGGEVVAEAGAQEQIDVTFTEGGTYTFVVDGETDWGSAFKVREQVAIDL